MEDIARRARQHQSFPFSHAGAVKAGSVVIAPDYPAVLRDLDADHLVFRACRPARLLKADHLIGLGDLHLETRQRIQPPRRAVPAQAALAPVPVRFFVCLLAAPGRDREPRDARDQTGAVGGVQPAERDVAQRLVLLRAHLLLVDDQRDQFVPPLLFFVRRLLDRPVMPFTLTAVAQAARQEGADAAQIQRSRMDPEVGLV